MVNQSSSDRVSIKTVKFCGRCAKPIGRQRVSSLTGWLFQETFCQCNIKQSSEGLEGANSGKTPAAGSLFGDLPGDKDTFDLPDLGGEYEVLERIGKGGMGSGYKVKDVELGRFLAIKVLHDELKDDQQSVSRFEREANAALKLMHANLVPVFSYGKSAVGAPYLVMDFVDGVSLDAKLKSETYLDVSSAIQIFIQICDALTHAHQHGIIHRDLKPGNIIITTESDGREVAKLVDFGIAKVRSGSGRETQNLTQTGEVFGSPHYMSPEQCLGFDLDSRSDLYSLGCVMYECLSGKSPFEGHNAVQLIAKHLSSEVPPLRICDTTQGVKVNDRLTEIVFKCLQKDPHDRYFSLELLAADLKMLTADVVENPGGLLVLPRKLSFTRFAFAVVSAASILSLGFLALSIPIKALLIVPIIAALLGAVLTNERINDFVTHTQFQPKNIRDAAGPCVRVLVGCHWLLALCVAAACSTFFLKLADNAYPVETAGLGLIIVIVVWTGFQQSVESNDIQSSITTGKVMHLISLSLIGILSFVMLQYFGAIVLLKSVADTEDPLSAHEPYFPSREKISEAALEERTTNSLLRDEATRPMPVGIWGDVSKDKISSQEIRNGEQWRVFKLPPNVVLGTFSSLTAKMENAVRAKGTVAFPMSDKVKLTLTPYAASQYAPLLRLFGPDDICALEIKDQVRTFTPENGNIDDLAYFVSNWHGLESFATADGDLTDYGLTKLHSCTLLQNLDVSRTHVTGSGVADLPQIKAFRTLFLQRISGIGTVIKALKRSATLQNLDVAKTDLTPTDLVEIGNLPNIRYLNLSWCSAVHDGTLRAISPMTKIESLDLTFDKVTPKSLSTILGFKSLKYLYLNSNYWPPDEVEKLRAQLPNCLVSSRNTGMVEPLYVEFANTATRDRRREEKSH